MSREERNGLRGSATSELNKVKFNFTNVDAEISMDLEYSGSGSYNYLFLKQSLVLLKVILISLSLHVLGIEDKPMVSVTVISLTGMSVDSKLGHWLIV